MHPENSSASHRAVLTWLQPPPHPKRNVRPPKVVPPRKFAIGDLMILVAGSALGCAWTRANWSSSGKRLVVATWAGWWNDWPTAIQLPTPLLFSLGFSALLCRFLPPRPPFAQIVRQPGVIALAILAFVLSLNVLWLGVEALFDFFDFFDRIEGTPIPFVLPNADELFVYQVVGTAPSLIICWILQRTIPQWGWWPERSWIDRTGRTLGVTLIVIEILWVLQAVTRLN